MKRLLLFIFLFLLKCNAVFAQSDCKLCGDWIGTFQERYPHDMQSDDGDWRMDKITMNIRINRYGNEYKIRQKNSYAGDIGTVYNNDEIEVITSTDTSIYWREIAALEAHYDQNNRVKYYDQTVMYYQVTYHNGYMHYSLIDSYYIEYDKYKKHISTSDFVNDQKNKPRYNLDLYKEDDNW